MLKGRISKQKGISVIELIVFIVIVGIIATTVMIGMERVLIGSGTAGNVGQANQLAQARAEMILAYRDYAGFSNAVDPCGLATVPAMCNAVISFASAQGYTVSVTTNTAVTNYKLFTISVSGPASATIQVRVAAYDSL